MEVKWADKVYNRATEVFLRKKEKGFIFKYAGIVEVIRVGESKRLFFRVISFCSQSQLRKHFVFCSRILSKMPSTFIFSE